MREAVFGDLYHIPAWRVCAVSGCAEILCKPSFLCEHHLVELGERLIAKCKRCGDEGWYIEGDWHKYCDCEAGICLAELN
jgi:hypothetical protein